MTIPAAILAAGASSRMGSAKALLPWGARTVLAAMIDTVLRAGLPVPAVVFGGDGDEVQAEARRLGAIPLPNPAYLAGRFTSVRVAARWATAQARSASSHAALLLWPVDCPGVSDSTLSALCRAAEDGPRSNVVPTFGGRGGHPVVLCAGTLEAIVAAPDDAVLRDLVSRAPGGRRAVAVDDPAVLDNVDTPEDYEAFLRSRKEVPTHG